MITNKLNLPQVFVNLMQETREPITNRYSVTELLGSTREIVLYRKYWDKIKTDVSDTIPALFGTAFHKLMEDNAPDNIQTEVKLETKFGDYTIVGKIDVVDEDRLTIGDYKTCTTSKIIKQDFETDRKQGLMYAWLYWKVTGKIMRHLEFYNLMKDWSKIKQMNSSNYPSNPIYVWKYDISDSDYDYIIEYIANKLKEILHAYDKLPECSNEERWNTGTKYAVYKNAGDKRAAIVCDSEQEAHDYITHKCNGAGQIEVRKGEDLKCNLYCNLREFCQKGE